MLRKIVYIFLFVSFLYGNDIRNTTESVIGNVFPGDVKYEMVKLDLPVNVKSDVEKKCGQKFFQPHLFIWKIERGEEKIGYAVLDNVYGKSMPITFLVVFDRELNIINSSIVKYREPYGGGVKNEDWNKQFEGKDSSSGFKVGSDIQGISGATISVNSVTKGIKKLALLMPAIADKL